MEWVPGEYRFFMLLKMSHNEKPFRGVGWGGEWGGGLDWVVAVEEICSPEYYHGWMIFHKVNLFISLVI